MPVPRFEVPAGAVDGGNTTFTTSVPYQPGTTAVFLNGLLLRPDLDDGWLETDPTTGVIDLKEAPRGTPVCPDVVQVFFLDTSPQLPEEVITEICGTLELDAADTLAGSLALDAALSGEVQSDVGLDALLTLEAALGGSVAAETSLEGVLRECD